MVAPSWRVDVTPAGCGGASARWRNHTPTQRTDIVSLMGSSILSEVDNTSISGPGSQTRQRFPLSWLPVSRLLPPRSGLERSDFVQWHIASFGFAAELRRI
jgi:hypothetical protein